MIEKTAGKYLEFLIHGFYDGILLIKEKSPTDNEMETLYAIGYNQFTIGNYELANKIFTNLTAVAPYTSFYWRALGAVNQQMENFSEGIAAYDMAIVNDPGDIVSHVYRSECLIMRGKKKEAIESLEKMLRNPKTNSPSIWVDRAKLIISAAKKKEDKK
ncbi:MAG: hypothetical protein ACTSRE_07305 [Promethearchaeota archaeon]